MTTRRLRPPGPPPRGRIGLFGLPLAIQASSVETRERRVHPHRPPQRAIERRARDAARSKHARRRHVYALRPRARGRNELAVPRRKAQQVRLRRLPAAADARPDRRRAMCPIALRSLLRVGRRPCGAASSAGSDSGSPSTLGHRARRRVASGRPRSARRPSASPRARRARGRLPDPPAAAAPRLGARGRQRLGRRLGAAPRRERRCSGTPQYFVPGQRRVRAALAVREDRHAAAREVAALGAVAAVGRLGLLRARTRCRR